MNADIPAQCKNGAESERLIFKYDKKTDTLWICPLDSDVDSIMLNDECRNAGAAKSIAFSGARRMAPVVAFDFPGCDKSSVLHRYNPRLEEGNLLCDAKDCAFISSAPYLGAMAATPECVIKKPIVTNPLPEFGTGKNLVVTLPNYKFAPVIAMGKDASTAKLCAKDASKIKVTATVKDASNKSATVSVVFAGSLGEKGCTANEVLADPAKKTDVSACSCGHNWMARFTPLQAGKYTLTFASSDKSVVMPTEPLAIEVQDKFYPDSDAQDKKTFYNRGILKDEGVGMSFSPSDSYSMLGVGKKAGLFKAVVTNAALDGCNTYDYLKTAKNAGFNAVTVDTEGGESVINDPVSAYRLTNWAEYAQTQGVALYYFLTSKPTAGANGLGTEFVLGGKNNVLLYKRAFAEQPNQNAPVSSPAKSLLEYNNGIIWRLEKKPTTNANGSSEVSRFPRAKGTNNGGNGNGGGTNNGNGGGTNNTNDSVALGGRTVTKGALAETTVENNGCIEEAALAEGASLFSLMQDSDCVTIKTETGRIADNTKLIAALDKMKTQGNVLANMQSCLSNASPKGKLKLQACASAKNNCLRLTRGEFSVEIMLDANGTVTTNPPTESGATCPASLVAATTTNNAGGNNNAGCVDKKTGLPITKKALADTPEKFDEEGIASFYGVPGEYPEGHVGACDVALSPSLMAAAHPKAGRSGGTAGMTEWCGKQVKVTNLDPASPSYQKSITVVINDNFPNPPTGRVIDLTTAAALALGFPKVGNLPDGLLKVGLTYSPTTANAVINNGGTNNGGTNNGGTNNGGTNNGGTNNGGTNNGGTNNGGTNNGGTTNGGT
ncbi:MAG: septal ring lytic transglycosylase RlpA family protein, partial [Rickettsiales bacterium]